MPEFYIKKNYINYVIIEHIIQICKLVVNKRKTITFYSYF